jgi:hypothetical protein
MTSAFMTFNPLSNTIPPILALTFNYAGTYIVSADQTGIIKYELESITLLDTTTQAFGAAARDAFPIFEDLCLLDNGGHPQLLQLEYFHESFALELIESVLTTTNSSVVRCVSPSLFPSETCMPAVVLIINLSRVDSIPSSYSYYDTISSPYSSITLRALRLPSSAPVLSSP